LSRASNKQAPAVNESATGAPPGPGGAPFCVSDILKGASFSLAVAKNWLQAAEMSGAGFIR